MISFRNHGRPPREDHAARVQRVLLRICVTRGEGLSPKALSKTACYAPGYFYRLFAQVAGEPVGASLRRRKLDAAAFCLATTRKQVTEIAFDAGFESHSAFARAFRARFRVSPSSFRGGFCSSPPSNRGPRIAMALTEFLSSSSGNRQLLGMA